MASRRQVREAAVQYLYALATSPDLDGSPDFWDLINDRAGISYDRARVKVLSHFQQGREATAGKLHQFFIDQSAGILALDPSEKLARDVKAHNASEIKWAGQAANLLLLTKADTGGWRRDLEKLLLECDTLRDHRKQLLDRLDNFPTLHQKQLLNLVEKLNTYDQRARMVRFPDKHPDQRDLDHLHRLQREMKALADEARQLADQVTACSDKLDAAIGQASTNFDLQRIARVDLAILRLATWEILKLPELDTAISINEAVSMARDFSGEESASFVNGVLDHIATTA